MVKNNRKYVEDSFSLEANQWIFRKIIGWCIMRIYL